MLAFLLALQSPKLDPRAMALLKKNRDAMLALHGYRARCMMVSKDLDPQPGASPVSYQFSILTAAKPNLMRYDMWEPKNPTFAAKRPDAPTALTIVSNGRKEWIQTRRQYRVLDSSDPKILQTVMEPWDGFYVSDDSLYGQALISQQKKDDISVRALSKEKIDGALCDKVEVDLKQAFDGKSIETVKTVYLRPDGLVRRQVMAVHMGPNSYTSTADLLHIEKNPDLRKQAYVYTPPKGVALQPPRDESLLANGTSAPDFVAKGKDGAAIKLSDLKGKVVVLDFWASWCGPCMASMPHTQSVADKLQKEGLPVVFLAVDDGEPSDGFNSWITKTGPTYPALTFAYSPQEAHVSTKLYNVTGIPTQYVIDARGAIRASFVGYGGPTDDLERAVRAALKAG